MNIIWGEENAKELEGRYTCLELEEFIIGTQVIKTYVALEAKDIRAEILPKLDTWISNHNAFVSGYRDQQWAFCQEIIGHLKGCFGAEMDEYYDLFSKRIEELENEDLPDDWSGRYDLNTKMVV